MSVGKTPYDLAVKSYQSQIPADANVSYPPGLSAGVQEPNVLLIATRRLENLIDQARGIYNITEENLIRILGNPGMPPSEATCEKTQPMPGQLNELMRAISSLQEQLNSLMAVLHSNLPRI